MKWGYRVRDERQMRNRYKILARCPKGKRTSEIYTFKGKNNKIWILRIML